MSERKIYVFDLDGTVADTINTIAYYVNETMKKHNLKTLEIEDYNYFVGEGASLLIERALRAQDKFEENLQYLEPLEDMEEDEEEDDKQQSFFK